MRLCAYSTLRERLTANEKPLSRLCAKQYLCQKSNEKSNRRGAEGEKKLAGLTHSKYPLLKKKECLSDEEKAQIDLLQKVAPELGEMYRNKEAIRDIFESPITSDEALDKFLEWTQAAYKLFPKSCRTICRWIDEILAYFDRRTTQGIVEGINQKIKLIKRRA